MTPEDIPDGLIDWDEHYLAWEGYVRSHPSGETAEAIEARGGFTYKELKTYLRRNPETWRPYDAIRYALFERKPEDVMNVDNNPPTAFDRERSHIFYAGAEEPVCRNGLDIPEAPIVFDVTKEAHCSACMVKIQRWLDWWISGGKI